MESTGFSWGERAREREREREGGGVQTNRETCIDKYLARWLGLRKKKKKDTLMKLKAKLQSS